MKKNESLLNALERAFHDLTGNYPSIEQDREMLRRVSAMTGNIDKSIEVVAFEVSRNLKRVTR